VLALLLAARAPERVAGVVTYAAFPVFDGGGEDVGYSAPFLRLLAGAADRRYLSEPPVLEQVVRVMAPGHADDPAFVRWVGRYGRLSAGPGGTAASFAALRGIDVRPVLPAVRAPVLVLQRAGDRVLRPGTGRALAARLAQGRYLELPGPDHVVWAGDVAAVGRAVADFLAVLPG
jgi:pimeloyl-ACP methyl ester carboxylesterase